jgi:hypothetical protein
MPRLSREDRLALKQFWEKQSRMSSYIPQAEEMFHLPHSQLSERYTEEEVIALCAVLNVLWGIKDTCTYDQLELLERICEYPRPRKLPRRPQ